MRKQRYEIEGLFWISITRAARLLATNALGVRKLMADGVLDWRQAEPNSTTLVVSEQDVMKHRAAHPPTRRRTHPSEKRRPKLGDRQDRRTSGGIFYEHHLRLTVPKDAKTGRTNPGRDDGEADEGTKRKDEKSRNQAS